VTDWLGLAGKNVVIAGAGGFGAAIALDMLGEGAVVTVADIDATKLEKLSQDAGDKLTTQVCDVSSESQCRSLIESVTATGTEIDVLVHAVGINNRVAIEEIAEGEIERMFSVNTASLLWLARTVAAGMRRRGGGHIVCISSVSGLLAHPHHGAYAATKGALNQLLKVMAVEWAADGVTVNAVAPGYALTPLTEAYCAVPGHLDELVSKIPARRLASVQDVASAALFLASDQAAYVTGQVLYVDGGRTLD
jgi:gluconate 5-dehydrogenase